MERERRGREGLIKQASTLDKYAYGMGNLAYGIIFQVITSFFMFYATSVLHISGSLTGGIVFLSVLWDAITDPIMGYISDNTYDTRFGKRHLYMILGAIGLAISNALLWSLRPKGHSLGIAVQLFVYLFLCKTFITVFSTPYTALGAEITTDYDERTSIQTIKGGFFLLGIALPMVAGMMIFFRPTSDYPLGQLNPDAYLPMGISTAVLSLLCAAACIICTLKYAVKWKKPKNPLQKTWRSILGDMVEPMKLAPVRHVIFGYLWQNVATAVVTSLFMHIFTYTFELNNRDVALIAASLLVTSVLSQVYWFRRTIAIDKKGSILESIKIAMGGCGFFLLMVFFRTYLLGRGVVFIPVAVIIGFAMGGMVSIPQTMLVDTIDLDELKSGKRKEGSVFACMTFCYKLSQSFALFVIGILLDLIGFDAAAGAQTVSTIYLLGLMLPILLSGVLVLTYRCFAKYSLDRRSVNQIQQELRENRAIHEK